MDLATRGACGLEVCGAQPANGASIHDDALDFDNIDMDFSTFLDDGPGGELLDPSGHSPQEEPPVVMEAGEGNSGAQDISLRQQANAPVQERAATGNLDGVQRIDLKLSRREKNRLAAARSNAKRKKQMDDLKANLANAKEMLRVLHEKEVILKRRNLELKDSAAQRWLEANGIRDK